MGGSERARQLIEERFFGLWTALPVYLSGFEYAIDPTTRVPVKEPVGGWVSLEIYDRTVDQATLGVTAIRRYRGVIMITVATALGIGSAPARKYADEITGYFRSKQDAGELTYYEPDIKYVGKRDGWFLMGVSVPYHLDLLL